ncbi:hypothetical protein CXB51_030626 [Gossypium anomalum]|uniref:Uncharacterized protein n=1 Tax=Gossypium anomalum TaxID=47600 RepID=A0A8J5Y4F5_9ROSI|nr:hypothetical protein CXB51_030626 [Gossypium anomalum]
MPLSTLISLLQNMETSKVPMCLNMKRYKRRKKYQRLKHTVLKHEDEDNEKVSMLEESCPRGTGEAMVRKVPSLPIDSLRKWRDAYVEMMLCFAAHVKQLNNNGNVYLFKRFPKPKSQCLVDN